MNENIVDESARMAERFRIIRKTLGINQSDFAERIGITQTALSVIELGKVKLVDRNIRLVCVIFGVNEEWLRYGTGEMFHSKSMCQNARLCVFSQLSVESQKFVRELMMRLWNMERK